MSTRPVKAPVDLIGLVWLLVVTFGVMPIASFAQDDRSTVQDSSSLTDGLLDLITEPKNETNIQPTGEGASQSNTGPRPPKKFTPADVGLEGEDLGENSANPLMSVRQSMLIAAGLLQRGTTDATTQELQSGIVQRLDELISQLEQDKPPSNRTSSQPQQAEQQSSSEKQETSKSKQQRSERSQPSPDSSELAKTKPNAQTPGQSGTAIDVEVALGDPKALQQNVWGHLPERMRTQMQSRMVEQFLPSYREQIEAYFKALLEQQ